MYTFDHPVDEALRRRHEMDMQKEMEELEAQRAARYGASYTQLVASRVARDKEQYLAESYGGWDYSPYHHPPSTMPSSSSSSSPSPPRGTKRPAHWQLTEPAQPKRSKKSRKMLDEQPLDTKAIAIEALRMLGKLSISQSSFASALGRAQGTISDLLRNPKDWSEMKGGRITFRRMKAFLDLSDEEKKMACVEAEAKKEKKAPRPRRRTFTAAQKRVLESAFSETSRPTLETERRLGEDVNLPFDVVHNFFQNMRRRAGQIRVNKDADEEENIRH